MGAKRGRRVPNGSVEGQPGGGAMKTPGGAEKRKAAHLKVSAAKATAKGCRAKAATPHGANVKPELFAGATRYSATNSTVRTVVSEPEPSYACMSRR